MSNKNKSLIIALMLFGLVVGTSKILAQTSVQPQALSPVPLLSPTSVSGEVPEVNLQPGVRSPHVKKVQEILKSLGYLPADLETTENFGSLTKEAIKKFQQDNNLPAFGFFGPATRAALKNRLKAVGGPTVIDRNVDINCMKTAVEKRENTLLTAWDTYSSKIKSARETRKTDLLAAWSIQDPTQRHAAVKSAWEQYRTSVKTATTEWNQSRKSTWLQFTQEAKNCRASAVETQDLETVETPTE